MRTHLPDVKSNPFTPPKVERETNTGTIQDMTPNTLSPNNYKPTTADDYDTSKLIKQNTDLFFSCGFEMAQSVVTKAIDTSRK